MKTSEFKNQIVRLGLKFRTGDFNIYVVGRPSRFEDWFVGVNRNHIGIIAVDSDYMDGTDSDYAAAIKIAVDYAFTPIAEREDKPKFFVHLIDYKFGYLAMTTGQWGIKPSLVLDTKDSVDDDGYNLNDNQAVFTELEYNKIRKYEFNKGYVLPEYDRQNTAMFEPVEAEDENE